MRTRQMMTAFAVTALVAGCSQNEITDLSPEANPAVGFGVYTGVQTRGIVMDNTMLATAPAGTATTKNGGGFGVLAYYTGQSNWYTSGAAGEPCKTTTPNFMYNQKVTYSGGWTYSPLKYWPNATGDKISFFAYAPYDNPVNFPTTSTVAIDNGIELSTVTGNGWPTLVFNLKASADKMVDLVTEQVVNVTKTTDAVKFTFDHVLSRAKFQARLDNSSIDNKTHIVVTGARILGTEKRDDPKSNVGNNVVANAESRFYQKATYKYETETWDYTGAVKWNATSGGGNAHYDLASVMNLAAVTYGSSTQYSKQGIVVIESGIGVKELFKQSATAGAAGEYLFLIPPYDGKTEADQGIKAATDVRVQLDYDIVTEDPALTNGYSVTSTTATVSLPVGTLKRNKAYAYIFTIGLEKVQVTATVTDWTTDNKVYIPSVDAAGTTKANIEAAITAMNTAKGNNPNCNYFVINVNTAVSGPSWTSLGGETGNFKVGDRIELNFTQKSTVSSSNITKSDWVLTGSLSNSVGTVVLTKTK